MSKTLKSGNVTRSRPSVSSMGKANMVAPHGHGNTKGGGANFKKTANTMGVQGKK